MLILTKKSKLKTKNHDPNFEDGEGRRKHEGFLFTEICFILNKKFPSFSMLHSSFLIVKKGERRRKHEGSGFFDLKK